ncbi:MAG: hypothetical protein ACE5E8_09480 [Acidimicrobiia bacterium]
MAPVRHDSDGCESFTRRLGEDLDTMRQELQARQEDLVEAGERIASLETQLEEVFRSETWKVGRVVLSVPRAVKRTFTKSSR